MGLAAAYLFIASLLCQATLVAMQLRTYRKTGHSSLAILALGSALAVLYIGFGFAAALHAPGTAASWWLYLAMEIVFTLQIVLAIWGSWSLFRAFAARCAGNDLDISRPETPIPAMPRNSRSRWRRSRG